jgi:SAM-dependent methyltransferase
MSGETTNGELTGPETVRGETMNGETMNAPPIAPDTFYARGFAEFYDRYGTGWTRLFAPVLRDWLEDRVPSAGRRVLDLACGTGVASQVFLDAGWAVTGVDLSEGMLGAAAERLAGPVSQGRMTLRRADMTSFDPGEPVSACVALEGPLNHLPSLDALEQCLRRVADALPASGTFVFDLYEPHHFRGWHNISVIDEQDTVVVKRGAWDDERAVGMLRISGYFDDGTGPLRVDQTVTSLAFPEQTVDALLEAAGFEAARFPGEVPPCACGRSPSGLCRTVYLATKRA